MAIQKYYVATVQLLVRADSEAAACDAISGVLSEQWQGTPYEGEGDLLDWGYLKLGGQYLYGTEAHYDPETYEEGRFQA